MTNTLVKKSPTSKVYQPSYPCDGYLLLSSFFTKLKSKEIKCKHFTAAVKHTLAFIIKTLIYKKERGRVDTTCVCCLKSLFLLLLALSISSDVSRPTVVLSWLKSLVCPENSRLDQSLWYLRPLSHLALQVLRCTFALPVKLVLKQAAIVEYL